jgi:two-component system, LuxR family, sensor kinase FixL
MTSADTTTTQGVYSRSSAARPGNPRGKLLIPALTVLLALVIFLSDTFSPIGFAVAVLYGIVVLMSATFLDRQAIIAVAIGCAALTVLSYGLEHAHDPREGPLLRCVISLAGLTITTFLALKNHTATEVLAASEERYRTIFESTAVAMWDEDYTGLAAALDALPRQGVRDLEAYLADHPEVVLDCIGRIRTLDVNEAALRLVDATTKEQLIASHAVTFCSESIPSLRALLLAVASRQDALEGEIAIKTLRGAKRSVLVAIRFPPGPRRFERVLVSLLDITERNKVQRALEETRAELAHISRVTTLGELTASIAHEVNQPLTAVVSNGEAGLRWLDRPVPDLGEVRSNIEHIIAQGRRAGDVVRRLRALSKNSDPQRVPIDINEAIEEAAGLVERELRDHGVSLRLELEPGLPELSVDRIQLQQVVINLVINAMHAMATVNVREVCVTSRSLQQGRVGISVSDCGIGLSDEAMSRLFTAFYTTKPQGMGLGLSICRSIIEAHGGRIRAERNEGPGAIFHICLPTQTEAA